eukprot:4536043-Amphidinium_carterae.1
MEVYSPECPRSFGSLEATRRSHSDTGAWRQVYDVTPEPSTVYAPRQTDRGRVPSVQTLDL